MEIIIEIPEVSHGIVIAKGAAGPDITIGSHVGIGDAGIAGQHLSFLFHDPDGKVIIYKPEGIGDPLKQNLFFAYQNEWRKQRTLWPVHRHGNQG